MSNKLPDHSKRYPGKLVRGGLEIGSVKSVDGTMIAMTFEIYTGTPQERNEHRNHNADHIVACWNACEGINPEAVSDLLQACKMAAFASKAEMELGGAPIIVDPEVFIRALKKAGVQ